ncbi:ParM/StbA family protein [Desmospora activa]|uniref:Uncharacterized protein n=1 Tax=Desmospora activa DSM 45169 TaxID=1121389 RepID=A0A2T4YZL5_9BACL|nr:hypothetical protein [Desmospora activa]PTM52704.1 hypothetical protein C8J48_3697 [Desmospora activa DSM 45169]
MAIINLGVDGGNNLGKVAGPHGATMFNSLMGEYKPNNLREGKLFDDDMVWEYLNNGTRGIAGEFVKYETKKGLSGTKKSMSKNHPQAGMRVLLGIVWYIEQFNITQREFNIGTLNTIGAIKLNGNQDKVEMQERLLGEHSLIVNDTRYDFRIHNVGVFPETAVAGLSDPVDDIHHVIELGSGQTGMATLLKSKYIAERSDTLSFGLQNGVTDNYGEIARRLTERAEELDWEQDELTRLCGGGAKVSALVKEIRDAFGSHLPILRPKLRLLDGRVIEEDPIYANSIAVQRLMEKKFGVVA